MTTAAQPVSNLPVVAEPISVPGITQAEYDKAEIFRQQLQENMPVIMAHLPKGTRAEVVTSMVMTTALDNPKLLECEPLSLMRATLKVAGLALRLGDTADIVPTEKNGRQLAECWIRVKGCAELAIRSGAIQWAKFGVICDRDEWSFEDEKLRHKPIATPSLDGSNVTHVYALIILRSGARVYEVWPKDRVLAHRDKYAKNLTKNGRPNMSSPWHKDPLPMWGKTVLKAALRYAPLSPEVRNAISAGDDVGEGEWEVVNDPTAALQSIDTAFAQLGAGPGEGKPSHLSSGETMTLAQAEAMVVPGAPDRWGGHGGQPLGEQKPSLLQRIRDWAADGGEKEQKFATLIMACDIILDDRADGDESSRTVDMFDDFPGSI